MDLALSKFDHKESQIIWQKATQFLGKPARLSFIPLLKFHCRMHHQWYNTVRLVHCQLPRALISSFWPLLLI